MTLIAHVATTMQTLLTVVADRAGQQSGFVQRSDAKLTESIFPQTLVFGLTAQPAASLGALTQTTAARRSTYHDDTSIIEPATDGACWRDALPTPSRCTDEVHLGIFGG